MKVWTIIATLASILAAISGIWMLFDGLLSKRKAAPFLSTTSLIDHNYRLIFLKNGGRAVARDIVIYFQHPALPRIHKVECALYPGQDYIIHFPSDSKPIVIEYEIEWSDDRQKRIREKKSVQILPK